MQKKKFYKTKSLQIYILVIKIMSITLNYVRTISYYIILY